MKSPVSEMRIESHNMILLMYKESVSVMDCCDNTLDSFVDPVTHYLSFVSTTQVGFY